MDILSYLSELVQTRKLVGIPGLGTIYKKKSPGRYDAETHSFIPPSYTLNFTKEIKEETALAEFISKHRDISIETASYFIEEFSNQLLQRLNNLQEADLGTVGKLSKVNNELVFEPASMQNYGFDFYGLPSIKAELLVTPAGIATDDNVNDNKSIDISEELIEPVPAEQEPIIQEPEKPSITSVVTDNEVSEENPGTQKKDTQRLHDEIEALNFYRNKIPADIPPPEQEETIQNSKESETVITPPSVQEEEFATVLPEEEERERKTSSIFLKILLFVLILLIILTATYILKPDFVNGLIGNNPAAHQAAVLPNDTSSKTNPVKDVILSGDTTKFSSGESTGTVKTKPVIKPTDTVTRYEIIGASVLNQKEADHFINLMKKSGITAKVVTNMPGRRLKMSIATLKDKKSADLERERLEKKLKIDGIYIYRNKPQ